MIENIYYVEDSEHPAFPPACLFKFATHQDKGNVINHTIEDKQIMFVSLGLIEFTDNEELKEKAKHILKELDI